MSYLQELYFRLESRDLLLIFISIAIGLVIGAEREYKSKTAGLRTLMLVCVGSCIFTILSIKIGVANPDRLAANIVTGIGFLGAGAIFKDENKVSGITTACTIWVTAALGMCVGSGHLYMALLATAVVIFVLMALLRLERWIDKVNRVRLYKITTNYTAGTIASFSDLFISHNLKAYPIQQTKTEESITVQWKVMGPQKNHDKVEALLLGDASVRKIEM